MVGSSTVNAVKQMVQKNVGRPSRERAGCVRGDWQCGQIGASGIGDRNAFAAPIS
jgi:hypothetical protein